MANITRFDPFSEMTRRDPFGDLDDMFKGFVMRPVFQGATAAPKMKLDVSEDDKSYTIKADIPGVKKEDIHISVDGNMVSISAEVKKETEKKEGKKVVHSERYFGQVSRSFMLDKEVDQTGASAKYADGVLEAVLPKKEGSAATQIAVS
ncbi:MAG: Hsp20/alpha crystallin family protein [Candidatus Accumulibacter sp.]|uniref:Hsp20/alpha crystallin family protein n=1 Tax=Accumulibacter sp. TaxID=2053492 RepID=UPI001DA9A13A|nr:Hsp20/alpha crystallin family protein [Accumulibacter sp.]MCB1942277.1 Hsp20/alpha crystallin family protein [Accumulibacter sp.]MCP5249881.1 Hsp20/alpha crystallin family protein [Accumulibacter sp.]